MVRLTELGKWNETQGKLKQKIAKLTDDDLLLAEGRQDLQIGRLQAKIAQTKEDLIKIILSL